MKKVLIFSLAYYPHVGGAEVAIKEITDRLADIEFHIITMRFSAAEAEIEKVGNVLVHRIGGGSSKLHKFLFQFRAAWVAHKLHKKESFDAVWAMMAHATGVPASLFKTWHKDVPYILNLQEGDPIAHIERTMLPLWPLFVRAFTKADVVQALSTYLAAWARVRGYKGPIEIIPNGVSISQFEGVPEAHERVVLITTSRLVHKNAVDDVIKALPLLPTLVQFRILGTGKEEVNLKAMAKKLGVEPRVEFVGYVDHAKLPEELHKADIFIRPSRSEGFGASFVEAMAAGLPVVATQEGGLADFLFDAKKNPDKAPTGFAVDKNSPEQIAEAVKTILAHPEQVAEVVKNAHAMVQEKYDWDIVARHMRERVFRPFLKVV
jgi:glycosyltransferase involved in cell wall biosynthesis